MYFLSLAFAYRDKKISLEQAKEILSEAFPQLEFKGLKDLYFVGDGTFLMFEDLAVEIRPSGTDAINKAYGMADSRSKAVKYATVLGNFNGTRNSLHQKHIDDGLYSNSKTRAFETLKDYQKKSAEKF